MTALEELREQAVGDEFLGLLRQTIRRVAVSAGTPPPDDRQSWDNESVDRVVSDFLADTQTPRRFADLSARCETEEALRVVLYTVVQHFFADLGRRTPIGKLVLRINDVLGADDRFERVDGRWRFCGAFVPAAVEDVDRLSASIRNADITVPKWGVDARRDAPVADAATIAELCSLMLVEAGGSLRTAAFALAIGERLAIGRAPISTNASGFETSSVVDGGQDSTSAEGLRAQRAVEVIGMLNDRERIAVGRSMYTMKELGAALGVSASQAHVIRGRAAALIKDAVRDDDDAEGVVSLVIEMASEWCDRWTNQSGPTY